MTDKYLNKIIQGNVLEVLPQMQADGVQVDCVVTSPPYWSLRKYPGEVLVWDGDKDCVHEWGEYEQKGADDRSGVGMRWQHKDAHYPNENPESYPNRTECYQHKINNAFCTRCSAWRGSLGLEPTIDLYISHLMQIFDALKPVLKKTGTLWVNLGDSFAGNQGRGEGKGYENIKGLPGKVVNGVQDKSLCGIPERFVIAILDRGWIKRNTVIWHKPNCMPSSASDRFTVDWEYVYFFTQSPKYWFEQQFEEHLTQEKRPDGIVRNRLFDYDSKENKLRGYKNKPNESILGMPQHHGKDINYGEQGRNRRCVFSANSQYMRLRKDLTIEQKLKVVNELLKRNII